MTDSDASAASDATNRPHILASLASLCGTDGVWGSRRGQCAELPTDGLILCKTCNLSRDSELFIEIHLPTGNCGRWSFGARDSDAK